MSLLVPSNVLSGRFSPPALLQDNVETRRAADMRYGEQVFEIGVLLDGVAWDGAGLTGRVRDALPLTACVQ